MPDIKELMGMYNPERTAGTQKQAELDGTRDEMLHNIFEDRASDIADSQLTNKQVKKYGRHDVLPSQYDTQEDLNRQLNENQSAVEKFGNMFVQIGLNEVALGSVLGVGYLVDFVANIGKPVGEDDYSSGFTRMLEDAQESVRDRFEIYQANPGERFGFDAGWWANNLVSVGSTLSLMIPSTGVMKGLGMLGKLAKVSKLSTGMAKAISSAGVKMGIRGAGQTGKIADTINATTNIVGNSLLQRLGENYMEGRQTYKDVYNEASDKLKLMSPKEKEMLLTRNPEFEGKSDDEIASYIASVSADKTFRNDWWMLGMDVVQFASVGKLFKGTRISASSAEQRIMNRNAARKLLGQTDGLEDINFRTKLWESTKDYMKHPWTNLELSEGLEEMFQGIQSEKGKEVYLQAFDPTYRKRSLDSYLKDGELWEQGFFGAIGGIVFGAAHSGFENLAEKYSMNRAAKKEAEALGMSLEDYKKSQLTWEKMKNAEIEGRIALFEKFKQDLDLINNGYDPYSSHKDEQTGETVYDKIEESNVSLMKKDVLDDFLEKLTYGAVEHGNADLLKEFMKSKEFKKAFEDLGVNVEKGEKTVQDYALDRFTEFSELYQRELYNVYDELTRTKKAREDESDLSNPNENIIKAIARQNVRNRLFRENVNDRIDGLSDEIDQKDDHIDAKAAYEQHLLYSSVNYRLNQIDEEIGKIENDKSLSEEAKKAKIDAYKREKHELFDWAGVTFGNNISEREKEYNDKVAKFANSDKAIEILERVSDGTKDLIKALLEAKRERVSLDHSYAGGAHTSTLSAYNELAESMELAYVQRLKDATDRVIKWLESQDDIDKAMDQLYHSSTINDNALQGELDLLKLGLPTRDIWTDIIKSNAERIKKERTEKEEESKKFETESGTVDGTVGESIRNDMEAATERATPVEEKTDEKTESAENTEKNKQEETKSEETNRKSSEETKSEPVQEDMKTEPAQEEQTKTEDIPIDMGEREEFNLPEEAETFVTRDDITDQEVLDSSKIAVEAMAKIESETALNDVNLIASSLAMARMAQLFKSDRDFILQAVGKDVNSEEVVKLIKAVSDYLIEQGVDINMCSRAAKEGVAAALKAIGRKYDAVNDPKASNFIRLADELFTKVRQEKAEDGTLSAITTLIEDEALKLAADRLIEEYVKLKGIEIRKDGKAHVCIANLVKYLRELPEIGDKEAAIILQNISGYLGNRNSKYEFVDLTDFLKAGSAENYITQLINEEESAPVATYMHVEPTSHKSDPKYKTTMASLKSGDKAIVEYVLDQDGMPTTSISIKVNGVEVGYLSTVESVDGTNTKYRKEVASRSRGFMYEVSKNENGTYTTNFDDLFNALIFHTTEEYRQLWELIEDYHNAGEFIIDFSNPVAENNRIAKLFLENPLIKKLIENGSIRFADSTIADIAKAKSIAYQLGNILIFKRSENAKAVLSSVNEWKSALFANYEQTQKIQERLDNGKPLEVTIRGFAGTNRKTLISEEKDIASLPLDPAAHYVIGMGGDKNAVSEKDGKTYSNVHFAPGTMGMCIDDNGKVPQIVEFANGKPVSSNEDIANAVKNELKSIISDFQNKKLTYEEAAEKLAKLLGGPGNPSSFFSGYSVIKGGEMTSVVVKGNAKAYTLILYKHKKGTNESGTGVTYFKNAGKDGVSSLHLGKNTLDKICNEILDNLTFNKSFFTLRNVKADNTTDNPYMKKVDGKFVIEFGGLRREYSNYGEFAIKENAFTTKNDHKNGSFFDTGVDPKSIYIDVDSVVDDTTPVKESRTEEEHKVTAEEIIQTASKSKANDTRELLEQIGVKDDLCDVLCGNNKYGISLLPKKYYFDSKRTKDRAYYNSKTKKIYITGVGAKSTSAAQIIRLLMHENLHNEINKHSLFDRENIVSDLLETYDALIAAIEEDLKGKPSSENYQEALAIKNWIEANKFDKNRYFESNEQSKSLTQEERDRIFAEEFLVESLTQAPLIRYLNGRNWKGKEVAVENVQEEKKSIFQKLIDILLDIFGIKSRRIKDNTILARQYQILAELNNIDNRENAETANNESLDDKTVENEETDDKNDETVGKNEEDYDKTDDDYQFDYDAKTSDILTENASKEDIQLDSFGRDPEHNPNGIGTISNMDDYVKRFPMQDRARIYNMMQRGELKFICR